MKKLSSKFIAALFIFTLFVSIFPINSFASGVTIACSSVKCSREDKTTVTLSLSGNPGITSLKLTVNFDSTALTLISAENLGLSDLTYQPGQKLQSPYTSYWAGTTSSTKNGDLLKLTFQCNDSADFQKYEIKITVKECFNTDDDVSVQVSSGFIEVNCPHKNTATIAGTAPTCNSSGYTDGVFCSDCNTYISGHEVLSATNDHTIGQCSPLDSVYHEGICSNCNEKFKSKHNFSSPNVIKNATCKEEGSQEFVCSDCGFVLIESIPKTSDHEYSSSVSDNKETHSSHCKICGDTIQEPHKWDSGQIVTPSTCSTKGSKKFTCSVCGETKIEELPLSDQHSYTVYAKENNDQHSVTCSECGKVIKENHSWDKGTITKNSTCAEHGIKEYQCTKCGQKKTEELPLSTNHSFKKWNSNGSENHSSECEICHKTTTEKHKWNSGVITVKPTCSETGLKVYTCTVCGEKKEETIPATNDHNFGEKWESNEDYHWKTCSECGCKSTSESHIIPSDLTEEDDVFCPVCGYLIQEGKKPEPHDHQFETIAISDKTGHSFICTICGEVSEIEEHQFDNECDTDCNLCGFVRTTTHTLEEGYESDENNHYKKCIICGEIIESHEHVPGEEATEDTPQTCTVCGYEIHPVMKHTHKPLESFSSDETHHWKTCSCGEMLEKEEHYFITEILKDPTFSDEGLEVLHCSKCGKEIQRTLEKLSFSEYFRSNKEIQLLTYILSAISFCVITAFIFVIIRHHKKDN